METLAILLLGWIIFGTILTIIGRFVYSKLLLDVPKDDLIDPAPPAPPPSSTSSPTVPTVAEKSNLSNTERFINTLKSNPPPAPPKLLQRSKSGSIRSSDGHQHQLGHQLGHQQHPDVPQVAGSNGDCVKWVTAALSFVYSRNQLWNDLIVSWKESLNASTKRAEIETGVSVEIQQLVFLEELPPRILNIVCEMSPTERATVTGDFESRFALLVRARREHGERQTISDYRLQVERLRGRINVVADTRDANAQVKFDGWPEVKITALKDDAETQPAKPSAASSSSSNEQLLLDIILEMVTSALRSATNELNWSRYPEFPRFLPSHVQMEPILPVHYDSMLESRTTRTMMMDKKLVVKVVRANGLVSVKDAHDVYAIIEMDDPPQRHQTAAKKVSDGSPFWDENFVFDVSSTTEEIMFELYSRSQGRNTAFLGLGIVGAEELPFGHSQRQIISLQSRPYENDAVSGTLTVEFLFVDSAEAANSVTAAMAPTGYQSNGVHMRRNVPNVPAETRYIEPVIVKDRLTLTRDVFDAVDPSDKKDPFARAPTAGESSLSLTTGSVTSSMAYTDEPERVVRGGRARKRNFFRSIKDRLSRSKKRSRSVDPGAPRDDSLSRDEILLRSVSVDRARAGQLLEVPGMVSSSELDGSTRSSLSEVSVISTASTSRTFLDEASTLVLETLENDIKKHYLIPMAMAEKRKWKKKGTKLHIFSDHVFVARHLPGGSPCQVCNQSLPRRLVGKQGYECRDCLLRCHKPCHVKVDTLCPNSSVHYMELEFVEGVDEAVGIAVRNGAL